MLSNGSLMEQSSKEQMTLTAALRSVRAFLHSHWNILYIHKQVIQEHFKRSISFPLGNTTFEFTPLERIVVLPTICQQVILDQF